MSILTDQPLVPLLGAAMLHGPMMNGLAAVPLPLVTQPQVVKPAFEVIVTAAWFDVPARAGAAWMAK